MGGIYVCPKRKNAPVIFMTLTGEAREAILNMDIEKLTEKTDANNLMAELDKMYLKDKSSLAYEAYETFKKFVRSSGMNISDYVVKFEQLYFKGKSFHMEILDSVLAYRLLNNANLTNEPKQLVKATVSKMDYQIMKNQFRKIFAITSTNIDNKADIDKIDVKLEENDVFYTSKNKNYRQHNSFRGSFSRNKKNFENRNYNKKMNSLNNKGEISRCNFCGSKFRWEKTVQMLQKNIVMIYDYMNN